MGKHHRLSFLLLVVSVVSLLELIRKDRILHHARHKSSSTFSYFVKFKDEYSQNGYFY